MSQPRFYCPDLPLNAGAFILPDEVFRHACRVLRLKEGDHLSLFSGSGYESAACLRLVEKNRATVDLAAPVLVNRESPLNITLLQALQSGDKMDFTIQKAVELGVNCVVPLVSKRSVLKLSGERASRREQHWRGVVVSACEQCGRNMVPDVLGMEPALSYLRGMQPRSPSELRLYLDPQGGVSLKDISVQAADSIVLLIGAEGGLDETEVEQATQVGFTGVRLGPRVLRTETAGLAVVSVLQAIWGDMC